MRKKMLLKNVSWGTKIILHNIKIMMVISYTLTGKILVWKKVTEISEIWQI